MLSPYSTHRCVLIRNMCTDPVHMDKKQCKNSPLHCTTLHCNLKHRTSLYYALQGLTVGPDSWTLGQVVQVTASSSSSSSQILLALIILPLLLLKSPCLPILGPLLVLLLFKLLVLLLLLLNFCSHDITPYPTSAPAPGEVLARAHTPSSTPAPAPAPAPAATGPDHPGPLPLPLHSGKRGGTHGFAARSFHST